MCQIDNNQRYLLSFSVKFQNQIYTLDEMKIGICLFGLLFAFRFLFVLLAVANQDKKEREWDLRGIGHEMKVK